MKKLIPDKTKCMVLSRHKNAAQNHNFLIVNRSFENVAKFKCLGTTVTNLNFMHKEIKGGLNLVID
jgi:hypothetical protein